MTRLQKLEIITSLTRAAQALRRTKMFSDDTAIKAKVDQHLNEIENLITELQRARPRAVGTSPTPAA